MPKEQGLEDISAWKVLEVARQSRSAMKFPWNEMEPIPLAAKLVPAGILAITAMNGLL